MTNNTINSQESLDASENSLKKRLFSYALWYTSRYSSSEKRLTALLSKRCNKLTEKAQLSGLDASGLDRSGIITEVFTELGPYFSEYLSAKSIVDMAVISRRPPNTTKRKLQQMGFSTTTVQKIGEEFSSYFNDFSQTSDRLERRIHELANRGYGKMYISSKISSEFGFEESVYSHIYETIDFEGLLSMYLDSKFAKPSKLDQGKEIEQTRVENIQREKALYSKLLSRGYDSGMIKRVIRGVLNH